MSTFPIRHLVLIASFVILLLVPARSGFAQADGGVSSSQRPASLMPLYVSMIGLQALDVDSTVRALHRGATREANPVVAAAAGAPWALVTVKAAGTVAIISINERLWKRNRVAAVALMVAANSGYAMVAAHNYSVAARAHSGRRVAAR